MAWLALGDRRTAEQHFAAARDGLLRTGDMRGGANALYGLALCQLRDGKPTAALASAVEAVDIIQRLNDRRLLPSATALVGSAQTESGDPDAAVGTLRSAIEASQDLHTADVEGVAWCYLGEAHLRRNDLPAAGAAFARSGDLLRRTELLSWQARVEYGTGRVAVAQADHDRARRAWSKAVELYAGTEPKRAAAIRGELSRLPAS